MPHNFVNWRAPVCNPEEPLQPFSCRVTLVGVGALGSQICLELTRTFPGIASRVTAIDPDMVQAENVPSSEAWSRLVSHFGKEVIGSYKSEVFTRFCSTLAPRTEWLHKACEFSDVGWGELAESNVIVTSTDSVVSRMEAAYAARMLGVPMLDAGLMGPGHAGGRVAHYAPDVDAACYSCGLSAGTRAAILEHLASPSLRCAALPVAEAMGGTPEGAASASSVAKRVVQQLAQGFGNRNSFAWRMQDDETDEVDLTASAECPWHSCAELIALEDDRPIQEALLPDDVLLLPWPMVLGTTCDTCGAHDGTPVRLAKLRQGALCVHCGAGSLRPARVIDRIQREDDVAERTPLQLGLPKRNFLPVRKRIQTQRTFLNS